ncbi:MAG: hypothetical protein WAZ18_01855 [Alphaproteobacteria bacterium]
MAIKPPSKPKPRRKVPSTSALDSALSALGALPQASAAQTAAVRKAASSPVRVASRPMGSMSPYPDLAMAISMLTHRAKNATGERRALIDKWIVQLTKMHAEMVKLRKLEVLADTLTKPHQESLPL